MTERDLAQARLLARAVVRACQASGMCDRLTRDLAAWEGGEFPPPPPQAARPDETRSGPERRVAAVRARFQEQVAPVTLRLLEVLARRNQFHLLPAVRQSITERLRRAAGRRRVVLTFAGAPEPATLERIRRRLLPQDASFDLETRVEPALLGGFTLLIDDRLLDLSLAGRLARIRKAVAA